MAESRHFACNRTDCKANFRKYEHGTPMCSALTPTAGIEHNTVTCAFFKTKEQNEHQLKTLIKHGHFVAKNSKEYENYVAGK